MNYLLDTNVLSEAMRKQPHPHVLRWIAAQADESLFVSAITIGELRRGALLLPDGRKRRTLQRWIETVVKAEFAGRILPLDLPVMERWADLESMTIKAGRRLPLLDSLLAATALAHGLIFVTRNTLDFQAAGIPLIDPWQEPG